MPKRILHLRFMSSSVASVAQCMLAEERPRHGGGINVLGRVPDDELRQGVAAGPGVTVAFDSVEDDVGAI